MGTVASSFLIAKHTEAERAAVQHNLDRCSKLEVKMTNHNVMDNKIIKRASVGELFLLKFLSPEQYDEWAGGLNTKARLVLTEVESRASVEVKDKLIVVTIKSFPEGLEYDERHWPACFLKKDKAPDWSLLLPTLSVELRSLKYTLEVHVPRRVKSDHDSR